MPSVGALLKIGVITPVIMVGDVWVAQTLFPGFDPRAKRAKDCGSAAVALAALAGGVAWVVVLVS